MKATRHLNLNDRNITARLDADPLTVQAEVWRIYGVEVPLMTVVERMALRLALQCRKT